MHSFDFPWRVAIDRGASYALMSSTAELPDASYNGPHERRPVVGDDVAADAATGRILDVAPRRSWIARARSTGAPQLVAANLTSAFVMTSPEAREFSPRRIVRYLIALRAGNVEPIVLLNKCDDDRDAGSQVAAIREIAGGAPVIPISALLRNQLRRLGRLSASRSDRRAMRVVGRGEIDAAESSRRRSVDGDERDARRRSRKAYDFRAAAGRFAERCRARRYSAGCVRLHRGRKGPTSIGLSVRFQIWRWVAGLPTAST